MFTRPLLIAAVSLGALVSSCGSSAPAEDLADAGQTQQTSPATSTKTASTELVSDLQAVPTTQPPTSTVAEPVTTTVAPTAGADLARAVAFVDENGTHLWTDVSLTTLSELPGWDLRWSRDGQWLTFSTTEAVMAYEIATQKLRDWSCEQCNGAVVVGDALVSLQPGGNLQIVELDSFDQYEIGTDLSGRVLDQFDSGVFAFPIAESGNGIIVDASIDGRSAYGGPTNLWHISLDGDVTELGATSGNVGVFRNAQDSTGRYLAYAEGWRGGFCAESHGVALVDLTTYQTVLLPHPLEQDAATENLWLSHLAWVGDQLYSTWSTSTTDPNLDGGGCQPVIDYTDYRLTDGSWERVEETSDPFTQPFGDGTLSWIEETETDDPNAYVPTNLQVDDEIIGYGVSVFVAAPENPSNAPAASPVASFSDHPCPVDVGVSTRLIASYETAGFDVTVCGPSNGMYWYHGESKESGNEILLDGYYGACSMYAINTEEGFSYGVDRERLVVTGPDGSVVFEEAVTTATCS